MIVARKALQQLQVLSQQFPVVAVLGPRQVGKTTLVKEFLPRIPKPNIYLDLEKLSDLTRLEEPELFLNEHRNHCVIIDEVQRKMDLFPLLRSLVDEKRESFRFIILASAGPNLLKRSSETLAGRIAYLELSGFNLLEISEICPMQTHHFRGGLPESTLAKSDDQSRNWLDNFILTYIERDLPMLGLRASSITIRRLWEMLAWQNGSLINFSSIGKSLGLSHHTIAGYIDFLENAYLITRLQPYYFNIKKRLVKSPKIYIRDTGILHRLLRINDFHQLSGSPFLGASWEAYVIEQINSLKTGDVDLYFYRTHAGAEMDLVLVKGLEPIATAEIKYTSSPRPGKSMLQCITDLATDRNFIIVPAQIDFPVHASVRACGLNIFLQKYLPALVLDRNSKTETP